MKDLIHIPEPRLLFRHNQATEDPRDGLTLFGPLDESRPYGIKAGVIGTETGIKSFERWVEWVQRPVFNATPLLGRPPFPGFETVFRSRWNTKPLLSLTVTDAEIDEFLYLDEPHQRVYGTVGVFANRILEAIREETEKPELWFVVVPDKVWKYCRPNSVVEPEVRQEAIRAFKKAKQAKTFYETRSLFPQMDREAEPYVYEEQFHNQLKARLLDAMVLTQIIKESTVSNIRKPGDADFDKRAAARQSEIAWNLCTAIFYKVGGRPWKVADIRDGVCYLGLVFKKDETSGTRKTPVARRRCFSIPGTEWYSRERSALV